MVAFQATIFRNLLSKENWEACGALVDQSALVNSVAVAILAVIRDLHKAVPGDLTVDELRLYVDSDSTGSWKEELLGALDEIEKASVVQVDALRLSIQQFVARQLAMRAVQEITKGANRQDFDPAEAASILNRAVTVRAESGGSQVFALEDSGDPNLETDRPKLIPLRWSPKLDAAIGGGVAAGEVAILLGGAKRGKTSLMTISGARSALAGANVLHVGIESGKYAPRKYDSALTGLDYQGLIDNPKTVAAARKRVQRAGGSVSFVDWSYQEHSPSDLVPLIQETVDMVGGVDLLVLDYLKLMVPDRTRSFSRQAQWEMKSKLVVDMCAVAAKLGVPVLTAWQANRSGYEESTVREVDTAECWDVVQHAHVLVGISRTKEEVKNKKARVHTILSRFGEEQVSITFDADFKRNYLKEV
jgi:hypothetical protein